MRSNPRKPIPLEDETAIIFANDRTCCICRLMKNVVIHHIDGNRNNNDPSNLAVLCSGCHDQVHKKGGSTRDISPRLVRKYKETWELIVKKKLIPHIGYIQPVKGIEKVLLKHEIKKNVYEIVALRDEDTTGIYQRLNFLFPIHLFEGYTKQILEALDYVLPWIVYTQENKTSVITIKLGVFFYHLVGPPKRRQQIKVKKTDVDSLRKAIEMLEIIGTAGMLSHSSKVLSSFCMTFEDIWQISNWYGLRANAAKMLECLADLLQCSRDQTLDKTTFTEGIGDILRMFRRLKEIAEKEQPRWSTSIAELNKLEKDFIKLTRIDS